MNKLPYIAFWMLLLFSLGVFAQDPKPSEPAEADEPITGGVTYEPERTDEGKLRDPFKSPFEIEQEERNKDKGVIKLADAENRLPFTVSELSLMGIYLRAETGYWAIFSVGGEYEWWQVGVKFRDGDLVNITDDAVIFKHYVSDDATQVREVVKELHRGEE